MAFLRGHLEGTFEGRQTRNQMVIWMVDTTLFEPHAQADVAPAGPRRPGGHRLRAGVLGHLAAEGARPPASIHAPWWYESRVTPGDLASRFTCGEPALDSSFHEQGQGRGLGQRLLGDALRRVLAAGGLVGSVDVIVDAENEAAEGFYLRHGFVIIDDASWPHRLLPGVPWRRPRRCTDVAFGMRRSEMSYNGHHVELDDRPGRSKSPSSRSTRTWSAHSEGTDPSGEPS